MTAPAALTGCLRAARYAEQNVAGLEQQIANAVATEIEDAAEADRTFSMLMGDEVPPRRAFIEANSKYAKIDA